MFETQNNQSTLAIQQPLDEIELISGQEIVELSGHELMNVVGGNKGDAQAPLLSVKLDENNDVTLGPLLTPEVQVDLTNGDEVITAKPNGGN